MRLKSKCLPLFVAGAMMSACSINPIHSNTQPTSSQNSGQSTQAITTKQLQDNVKTIVVIYTENRSFDNLYGLYPGADGIPGVNPSSSQSKAAPQLDRDGKVLATLPKTWGGVVNGKPDVIPEASTGGKPNQPFQIDAPTAQGGFDLPLDVNTIDLVHRFFNNQMQINGGNNDKFAAYSNAGGLSMGYYDGSKMKLWKYAQDYVLADNFFQGAFGGSYLNHQYLICACVPTYPNDGIAVTGGSKVSAVIPNTNQLATKPTSPVSALDGAPQYVSDGSLTPPNYLGDGKYYTINTMQPPYQLSANKAPPTDTTNTLADLNSVTTEYPVTNTNIGDLLDNKGISWAWYSGGWNEALKDPNQIYGGRLQFQTHHQPFNYSIKADPTTVSGQAYRKKHFKDFDEAFLQDAKAGNLPAVTFYKSSGILNQHPGYAQVADGDAHVAEVVAQLQQSPQWKNMVIVITSDENGGFWDHKRVPKGDVWGPGTRIPALVISPLAKRGVVDHTQYDTASILRLITRVFDLPKLDGLKQRDNALVKNGGVAMGDLTNTLDVKTFARK
ncbi:acid phosphatase [Acinetobacter sp. c1-l78]|uniref:acid phosphatase n=1 Tax=Acinetobacter sp. c1-l78 TaxID=3342803 RepID=UPI0035B93948